MPRHDINIQDSFLFQSLKQRRRLNIALVTGKGFNGVRIKRFDRFAVVVDTGSQDVLVYKHSISTIADVAGAPARDDDRPPPLARQRLPGGPGRATSHWAR